MGRVARVLPGMQSAFVEIGLERAAFLHVADIWEERQNGPANGDLRRRRDAPDRADPRRGPAADGAGDQGPDRHQGRAPVDADLDRRAAARATCRRTRTSASRSASRTRPGASVLRERLQQLLPPDESGGFIIRTMAETATEAELANDVDYLRTLWDDIRERSQTVARAVAAAPGPLAGAARAARLRQRRHRAHPDRLARDLHATAGVRASTTCPKCWRRSSSTTPGSGRCSTSTTSRTRSSARSRAASI